MYEKTEKFIQPKVTRIDETHFMLNEDYTYYWKKSARNPDTGEKYDVHSWITVKAGFRWDGASVPGFFRKFGLATDGPHRAAALIHDFIYVHEGELPDGSMVSSINESAEKIVQHGSFSREDADRFFGRMMKQAGVEPNKWRFMRWGVASFGWIYWQDGPDLKRKLFWNMLSFVLIVLTMVMLSVSVLDDTTRVIGLSILGIFVIGMVLKTLRFSFRKLFSK